MVECTSEEETSWVKLAVAPTASTRSSKPTADAGNQPLSFQILLHLKLAKPGTSSPYGASVDCMSQNVPASSRSCTNATEIACRY